MAHFTAAETTPIACSTVSLSAALAKLAAIYIVIVSKLARETETRDAERQNITLLCGTTPKCYQNLRQQGNFNPINFHWLKSIPVISPHKLEVITFTASRNTVKTTCALRQAPHCTLTSHPSQPAQRPGISTPRARSQCTFRFPPQTYRPCHPPTPRPLHLQTLLS
jgi:hypothetical protein